jgi:hypothetical protein
MTTEHSPDTIAPYIMSFHEFRETFTERWDNINVDMHDLYSAYLKSHEEKICSDEPQVHDNIYSPTEVLKHCATIQKEIAFRQGQLIDFFV